MGQALILGTPRAAGTAVEGETKVQAKASHLVVLKSLLLLLSPTHHSSHLPANRKPESTHPSLKQVCVSTRSEIKLFPFHCACLCAQSCLTLCDPVDRSPPGSSVLGVF